MLPQVGTTVTAQNHGGDQGHSAAGAYWQRSGLTIRQNRLALLDIVACHEHGPATGVLFEVEAVLFLGDFEAWVKAVPAWDRKSGPVNSSQVHRRCRGQQRAEDCGGTAESE